MIVGYIKARLFLAKLQSELMAQCNNQSLVNQVIQSEKSLVLCKKLREEAYYRDTNVAPFLMVCEILGEAIGNEMLPLEIRSLCAKYLNDRRKKASSNQSFRNKHAVIFDTLEKNLTQWNANSNNNT